MKYRAEIDGLRAIAIISVILFHAGFELFKGGFVGVDIFFVISGYLITTTVCSDLDRGTFSILEFYERRARRILPALYLVMFVSLPFAWVWLRPPDMKDFAQSLVAIPYQLSNVLFWLETGYWGTENALKPFIHTWSIAVEAQYYLLFPLFLMVMGRHRKVWLLPSLLAIAGVSFMGAQWGAYQIPSGNFFLLPSRLWELAMGACIALCSMYQPQASKALVSRPYINNWLGFIGLSLIAYSIFSFDETVPFPSVFTLIPAVGTGLLLIFSSLETLTGRLLGTPVLVGVGVISYSAYLWHQPLLAFARHRSITEPGLFMIGAIILILVPLAYLSWRYVEQPFRSKAIISKKAVFILWLIASIALIEIGVAGHMTEGFIGRKANHQPVVDALNEIDISSLNRASASTFIKQTKTVPFQPNGQPEMQYNYGLSVTCDGPFTLSPDCRTSDEPEILVWGDSFAMQLVPGILASNPEAKLIQMTKSVCGPFFDLAPIVEPDFPVRWARECLEFNAQVRDWLSTNNSVRYAVLASPFSHYHLTGRKLLHRNGDIVEANADLAFQEFRNTLSELESLGVRPIIFSPPPAASFDLGRCLSRAEWMELSPDICNYRADEMVAERIRTYRFLESLQKTYSIFRLDQQMCEDLHCKVHVKNVQLYRDSQHFTTEGAAILGQQYNFYGVIVGQ